MDNTVLGSAIHRSGSRNVRNAIDFDAHGFGYHAGLHRGSCWCIVREILGVDLVHSSKIFRVCKEYGALDDIPQGSAAAAKNMRNAFQCKAGFVGDISEGELVSLGINRPLP